MPRSQKFVAEVLRRPPVGFLGTNHSQMRRLPRRGGRQRSFIMQMLDRLGLERVRAVLAFGGSFVAVVIDDGAMVDRPVHKHEIGGENKNHNDGNEHAGKAVVWSPERSLVFGLCLGARV